MRSFGSDNHSGIDPLILKAVETANRSHAVAYGDDDWTAKAEALIRSVFGPEATPFFVFNGTGANTVALRTVVRPYHSILAAATGHIVMDECGAPGFMSGASVKEIPTQNGKLTPSLILPYLVHVGFEHSSQPKVVYISQCTELGTVYTIEEIRQLADFLHEHDMYLHIDGARIANAAVTLGVSFKKMITDTGVDILSFGGTKNGMMMGEAVISFRPELSKDLRYIRKQSAQLFSKMRYISAQFIAYFENEIWLKNASHANKMARQLRKGLSDLYPIEFSQPTEANIVLLKLPKHVIDRLLQRHFFYVWNESENEIRLVTSWDTTERDIELFLNDVKEMIL